MGIPLRVGHMCYESPQRKYMHIRFRRVTWKYKYFGLISHELCQSLLPSFYTGKISYMFIVIRYDIIVVYFPWFW